MRPRRTKTIALLAATAVAVCSAALVTCWSDLWRAYYAYRLRGGPDSFLQALENPTAAEMRDALEDFLRTDRGRRSLFDAFMTEVIDEYLRTDLRRRPLILNAGDVCWLGPQPGLQHTTEPHVAVCYLQRWSPTSVGMGFSRVVAPERYGLVKAIQSYLPRLKNHVFSVPTLPGRRLGFRPWGEYVGLAQGLELEMSPVESDIVCIVLDESSASFTVTP